MASEDLPADALTKSLSGPQLLRHKRQLHVYPSDHSESSCVPAGLRSFDSYNSILINLKLTVEQKSLLTLLKFASSFVLISQRPRQIDYIPRVTP